MTRLACVPDFEPGVIRIRGELWKGTWGERKPAEQGRQTMTVEESGSGWNSRTRQPAQNGWDDGVHRRDGAIDGS